MERMQKTTCRPRSGEPEGSPQDGGGGGLKNAEGKVAVQVEMRKNRNGRLEAEQCLAHYLPRSLRRTYDRWREAPLSSAKNAHYQGPKVRARWEGVVG